MNLNFDINSDDLSELLYISYYQSKQYYAEHLTSVHHQIYFKLNLVVSFQSTGYRSYKMDIVLLGKFQIFFRLLQNSIRSSFYSKETGFTLDLKYNI